MFLGFQAIAQALLLTLFEFHRTIQDLAGVSRFTTYAWFVNGCLITDILGALLLLLMLQDLFRYSFTPLPGISQLGVQAFRWAAVISLLVSSSTLFTPVDRPQLRIVEVASGLTRCIGIVELCLLAFFVMALHKVGLTFRSRIFGISLTMGVLATWNFIQGALFLRNPHMGLLLNDWQEYVTVFSLGVWIVYMLVPEPVRRPVTVPSTSPLIEWNEIALRLGRGPAHIAVSQPANASFLQGVEEVVQRVKAKHSTNPG